MQAFTNFVNGQHVDAKVQQFFHDAGLCFCVPLDHIERNPFQTRTRFDEAQLTELTQSIAASGVVQPIVVRLLSQPIGQVKYQLITGERRWIASRKAGKSIRGTNRSSYVI